MDIADSAADKQEVPGSRMLVENIYRYTDVNTRSEFSGKSRVLKVFVRLTSPATSYVLPNGDNADV
jgi:hypothetical protein